MNPADSDTAVQLRQLATRWADERHIPDRDRCAPTEADLAAWLPHTSGEALARVDERASNEGWETAVEADAAALVFVTVPRIPGGEVPAWRVHRETLAEVCAAWQQRAGEVRTASGVVLEQGPPPPHPVAPLVADWLERSPRPVRPYGLKHGRRASLPHLHRTRPEETNEFPELNWSATATGLAPARPQLEMQLPGELSAPQIEHCPSWLLWAFDRAGDPRAPGAPWSLHLWLSFLLHMPIERRNGTWHRLAIKTPELVSWLHPNGWNNRRRDWHKLPEALHQLDRRLSFIPVEGVGSVALMRLMVIPEKPDDPGVVIILSVPRSAARGARIDWPTLCDYRRRSYPLYRAYLAVCAFLDESARHGNPQRRQLGDGRPNPAARFVAGLSDADLARMLGYADIGRMQRSRARAAIETLAADGVIEIAPAPRGRVHLFGR